MDFDKRCRTCLSKADILFSPFTRIMINDKSITYSDMIFECTNINLLENDTYASICDICTEDVIRAYKFRLKTIETDSFFRQYLSENCNSNLVSIQNAYDVSSKIKSEVVINSEDGSEKTVYVIEEIDDSNQNLSFDENNLDLQEIAVNSSKQENEDFIKTESELTFQDYSDNLNFDIYQDQPSETIAPGNDILAPHTYESFQSESMNYDNEIYKEQKKPFQKHKCKIVFSSISDKLKCKQCGKIYHKNGVSKRKSFNQSTDDRPFQCQICDKAFKTSIILKNHMFLHSEKPLKCYICDYKCIQKICLEKHIQAHERDNLIIEITDCNVCNESFNTQKELEKHIAVHLTDRASLCPLCPKIFFRPSLLKAHLIVHSDVRPHQCDKCDRAYKSQKNLSIHMLSHNDEKPIKCGFCDYSCISNPMLKQHHVHSHRDKPLIKCKVCNFTFPTKSYIQQHYIRRHTKERQLKCIICAKKFRSKNGLDKHIVKHV